MTITLQPIQEQAIRSGAFRSVDEFLNAAIAMLPISASEHLTGPPRKSRLWELREGLTLGDLSIKELIEEGRERL